MFSPLVLPEPAAALRQAWIAWRAKGRTWSRSECTPTHQRGWNAFGGSAAPTLTSARWPPRDLGVDAKRCHMVASPLAWAMDSNHCSLAAARTAPICSAVNG